MKTSISDTRLCAADLLRRVSRTLTSRYEQSLREVDLTIGQFSILSALAQLRDCDPHGIPVGALANILDLDRTTLTRNLGPLRRRGLVKHADGEDRRTRLIAITGRGRRLLDRALPLWRLAQEETLDHVGRGRWQALRRELLALADL